MKSDLMMGEGRQRNVWDPGRETGMQEPRSGHLKMDKSHPKASGILGGPHLGCNGMTGTDLRVGSGEEDPVSGCAQGALLLSVGQCRVTET